MAQKKNYMIKLVERNREVYKNQNKERDKLKKKHKRKAQPINLTRTHEDIVSEIRHLASAGMSILK